MKLENEALIASGALLTCDGCGSNDEVILKRRSDREGWFCTLCRRADIRRQYAQVEQTLLGAAVGILRRLFRC